MLELNRLKKKKQKILKKKILFFIFLFLLVLIAFFFIFKIPKLNIQNIEISGNKIIENQNIKDVINKKLSGKYFKFIPKSFFLFYPKKEIKNILMDQFEELEKVSVSLDIKKENLLKIDISEKEAKYIWCGSDLIIENLENEGNENPSLAPQAPSLTPQDKCFFMNQNGYIFTTAPVFSDNVYFKFYGFLNEKEKNKLNLPENFFIEFPNFRKNLEQIGINIYSMFIKNDGDLEIYFSNSKNTNILEQKSKIILKKDADLKKIFKNLKTAIPAEPIKSNFENIIYLDLRLNNKIYYKFKREGK